MSTSTSSPNSSALAGIHVIPKPAQLDALGDPFLITPTTVIVAGESAQRKAEQLAAWLRPATGFPLPIEVPEATSPKSAIVLTLNAGLSELGGEGYTLEVQPKRIDVQAATEAGLFYGITTLRQLLPPQAFNDSAPEDASAVSWLVPGVRIADQPRFGWRGAHLDCCRHFMPLEDVKKFIDLLALHKMNVFHWHLTEDQGWRLEIKRYPKLTEVGAWRKETRVGHERDENVRFDGTRYGGFYTQDEAREIVAYAAERHIAVLPEIEMPGHACAAIAAYPELGNADELDKMDVETATHWGIFPQVLNVEDKTIEFFKNVLREVLDIFPNPYIHVGGDECPKDEWKESPNAQKRIKELGLADEDALQSWFIRQMDTFLNEQGRTLVGWDEILEGGLAQNAVVMSWRGEAGGIHAAQSGHNVVMASNHHTYFDYYQSQDKANEPLAIGGFLPLAKVYSYEPIPAELDAEQGARVLGAQCQHWTEYMPDFAQVEYMSYPRTCALSEVVWSPREGRSYDEFSQRLPTHLERLKALKVNFRPLDPKG